MDHQIISPKIEPACESESSVIWLSQNQGLLINSAGSEKQEPIQADKHGRFNPNISCSLIVKLDLDHVNNASLCM